MKKYIFTFSEALNYGEFLQEYSLQKEIYNSFSVLPKYTLEHYQFFVGKRLKRIYFFWRIISLFRLVRAKWNLKQNFIERKKINYYCMDYFSSTGYIDLKGSIAICGSDQIWNPRFISNREHIYFANIAVFSKRISYAASLGMPNWPKDFEQKVLPMLQCFDAISVREESAVTYLTSLGLKNVVCVCDPTILHNGDFYRNEFLYEKTTESFTFVYKIREVIPEYLKELFEKNVRYVDLGKRKNVVSVTDWLANIDNAKFIVTDSFHCAVFCILFHKPFLVLPNRGTMQGMNERFETLLGKTNLKYRVLSSEDTKEVALAKLNTPIDWDKIDSIMEEWRNYSANWLKKALEK